MHYAALFLCISRTVNCVDIISLRINILLGANYLTIKEVIMIPGIVRSRAKKMLILLFHLH